ncbi:Coiled-coil domain-containing protein 81 [Geodia barretti]|uniref:Coiled-coil domain-containing protein 81 n=1 Tax=Geodia barretti TaxID=519541 RepID=A0AA35R4W2_GEOBA|nr:Coiled-coil domain-containing protein 81 [Geodia barretti]
MAATLGSLVSETKRNRLSLIGSLTEDAVLHVWDKVAQFVETHMLQQKGVSIGGLGTFTFSKRKLEVGNNRAILIQRPVFVLSERFKQTHSLHCVKKHASGQVPLHPLNYTQLSNMTGVRREMVEGAVREVLQALSRAVAAKKSIEFDLKDIGRLTIHDGKAKLSFFREFIYRLDGCCDMEGAFRSSSTDSSICSIISNPQPSSRSSSSLSLPRIVQPVVVRML